MDICIFVFAICGCLHLTGAAPFVQVSSSDVRQRILDAPNYELLNSLAKAVEDEIEANMDKYITSVVLPQACSGSRSEMTSEQNYSLDHHQDAIKKAANELLLSQRKLSDVIEAGRDSLRNDATCRLTDAEKVKSPCGYTCTVRSADREFLCENFSMILPFLANLQNQIAIQIGPITDNIESSHVSVDGASIAELQCHNMEISRAVTMDTGNLRKLLKMAQDIN
ncbi:hypothetical protein CAPTEDRAFT_189119 [Capitella teleta]|uniref:Protein TsetseEP domain-containing protein n=1 Tax=Capitella teleta TaxID=283909 RepID=R7T3I0_CAPTE|nr:hypothetical protein CAPTEDRAFT_189119 [Capitella teleta]|eukprot:ELT87322.1 hypothetical protein CAPTEDRAFT_189119 [Capitella teleta]